MAGDGSPPLCVGTPAHPGDGPALLGSRGWIWALHGAEGSPLQGVGRLQQGVGMVSVQGGCSKGCPGGAQKPTSDSLNPIRPQVLATTAPGTEPSRDSPGFQGDRHLQLIGPLKNTEGSGRPNQHHSRSTLSQPVPRPGLRIKKQAHPALGLWPSPHTSPTSSPVCTSPSSPALLCSRPPVSASCLQEGAIPQTKPQKLTPSKEAAGGVLPQISEPRAGRESSVSMPCSEGTTQEGPTDRGSQPWGEPCPTEPGLARPTVPKTARGPPRPHPHHPEMPAGFVPSSARTSAAVCRP